MHERHVAFTTEEGAGHDVAHLFAFTDIHVKQYYVYDGIGATKNVQTKWNDTGASTSVTHGGTWGGWDPPNQEIRADVINPGALGPAWG